MDRVEIGTKLFKEGYNCCQAVVGAFIDLLPIGSDSAMKLASPFGAGIGRLMEVCGAVSGMMMVAGFLFGNSDGKLESKGDTYALAQKLAEKFKAINGKSIVCKELLGLTGKEDPKPSERTDDYYKKRPCVMLVQDAIKVLLEEMEERNML